MCLTMKGTHYTRPIPVEGREETNSGWKNKVYALFSGQHLGTDAGRDGVEGTGTWQPCGDGKGEQGLGNAPTGRTTETARPRNTSPGGAHAGHLPGITEQSAGCLQGPGLWEKQGGRSLFGGGH